MFLVATNSAKFQCRKIPQKTNNFVARFGRRPKFGRNQTCQQDDKNFVSDQILFSFAMGATKIIRHLEG